MIGCKVLGRMMQATSRAISPESRVWIFEWEVGEVRR